MKTINPCLQGIHNSQAQHEENQTSKERYITIKLLKTTDKKKKILKIVRKIPYSEANIRMTAIVCMK